MNHRDGTNYYELLEVPTDAHSSEIHKAYQRAKHTYSQDNPALYSMFSPEEARELLRLIEEAYQVLNNPAMRKVYDDALLGKGAPPPAPRSQPVQQQPSQSYSSQTTVSMPVSQAVAAAAPSSSMTDAYSVRAPYGAAKSPPPAGQGRTQHSNYKLDENFESEIANAIEFDGGLLQRIRVYKNISLEKMSESTRISRPYLTAVENNDFKSLPAAVFVRGFVVQIARQLALDEKKVAESYMKGFKAGGGK